MAVENERCLTRLHVPLSTLSMDASSPESGAPSHSSTEADLVVSSALLARSVWAGVTERLPEVDGGSETTL